MDYWWYRHYRDGLDDNAGSTVLRLKGDIDRYVNNNYSNPEDFPLKFARQVLYLPLVFILAGWVLFLTRNPWLLFSLNILYSIVFVWILCVILYPQDGRALPESQTEICTPPDLCCEEGSVEDEVLSIIGRHFKEPHLLKTEVLSEVSRGNVRKADRFITLYGYYRLVNMFRLEYARLYKLSNPGCDTGFDRVRVGLYFQGDFLQGEKVRWRD